MWIVVQKSTQGCPKFVPLSCIFLSARMRQLALLQIVFFSLLVIKSQIKSNYPKSTPTHSEPPKHTFPKNSNTIPIQFLKNSLRIPISLILLYFVNICQILHSFRIPEEVLKNSWKIPKEFLKNSQRISKEFPKNF